MAIENDLLQLELYNTVQGIGSTFCYIGMIEFKMDNDRIFLLRQRRQGAYTNEYG
jgi:hypothetical protein